MEPVAAALTAPTADAVRARVLAQLVESLVFERVLATEHSPTPRASDASWLARDASNDALLPPWRGRTAHRVGPYAFVTSGEHAFGRVRLDGPVLRDGVPATDPARFLAEVADHLDADDACRDRFAVELAATVLNDALAQHHRTGRDDRADPDAGHDALEPLITEGHRYHPAYKSRLGFSTDDQRAYGPEFAPTVRPLWLGLDPTITTSSGADPRAVWENQFPGGVPDDLVAIPVHPWQWRHHVARAFAAEVADGRVRVLGEDGHDYRPQQSIRTLACVDAPRLPSPKLSLSITNTSTARGIAPYTVRNAAPISDWLATIASTDPVLRDKARLIVLRELAGTSASAGPREREGALSCLWRESLHVHLHPAERAVPFPGLTSRALDGTPLIDPWIREQGAAGWAGRLVTAAVLPLVHLLLAHGVAHEAHAQNMLLVHAGGLPTRVALKDFHDGLRFSRTLTPTAPPLEAPPAHHGNANSFLETDDPRLVTGFLLDALCFVNLAEIAHLLASDYGLAEPAFWALVRDAVRAHAERHALTGSPFDVFAPTLEVERLTTRRLHPDTELRLMTVPNPLAAHP